jgi:hypothetical protein
MKRSTLQQYRDWPDCYVAMHGLRQIKRGRRPSLPLGNVRNPEEAFKFAWLSWYMRQYFSDYGAKTDLFGELRWVRPGVYTIDNKPVPRQVLVIAELGQIAFDLKHDGFLISAHDSELYIGPIMFEVVLNGVTVRIDASSHCFTLERDRKRAQDGCIEGPVGPRHNRHLSEEEIAHDAAVRAENERQLFMKQHAYDQEMRRRQQVLDDRLKELPHMEVPNPSTMTPWYANKTVSYDTIQFAQRWARLMQGELAKGNELGATAERSFYDAIGGKGLLSYEGFEAARILFACWSHGAALKQWAQSATNHMLSGMIIPA